MTLKAINIYLIQRPVQDVRKGFLFDMEVCPVPPPPTLTTTPM